MTMATVLRALGMLHLPEGVVRFLYVLGVRPEQRRAKRLHGAALLRSLQTRMREGPLPADVVQKSGDPLGPKLTPPRPSQPTAKIG